MALKRRPTTAGRVILPVIKPVMVTLKTKFIENKKDIGYIPPFLRRTEMPVHCLSKRQQALYAAGKLVL